MATILIVDDTPENLSVLNGLLSPLHRVRAVNSGQRALRAAASQPRPDLILLDVMMPGMDGYEVIGRLQADPGTADIPVIFVSALDGSDDEERGLTLGAKDYTRSSSFNCLTSPSKWRVLSPDRTPCLLKPCHSRPATFSN